MEIHDLALGRSPKGRQAASSFLASITPCRAMLALLNSQRIDFGVSADLMGRPREILSYGERGFLYRCVVLTLST